jgi:hypothetical protein
MTARKNVDGGGTDINTAIYNATTGLLSLADALNGSLFVFTRLPGLLQSIRKLCSRFYLAFE